MKRILLIVGNGLSIDLWKYLELDINPSSPFSFKVPHPFDNTKKLLDELTRVRNLIGSHPNLTNFDIIHDFVGNYQNTDQEHQRTHSELRQYLSLAYSYANNNLLHHWKEGWRWEQWLRKYHDRIAGIVSFNYDLTVETVLKRSSFRCYRISSTEEGDITDIPIFKPHGSCDFDISAIYIHPKARLRTVTFLNSSFGRVEIVPKGELLEPRNESDIVLPFESSPQLQLPWVERGYEAVKKIAKTVDSCIIVGISYQPCDRLEIDSIVDAVPMNTPIKLIDPRRKEDLFNKLKMIDPKVKAVRPDDFLDYCI